MKWVVTSTVTPFSTRPLICVQNSRRVIGIDAGGRLVEEQHLRLVHDRAGERQPLLQAERQILGRHVGVAALKSKISVIRAMRSRLRCPDSP